MTLAPVLISGLGLGSMYGLIALGFHVTYTVSGALNFAQGSSVMLGAVFCYVFATLLGWPAPLAIVAALALCAAYGLLVERLAVRPFLARGSDAWLVATVALGLVTDNLVLFTFGNEPHSLPSSLATSSLPALGVFPLQVLIPVVGLAAAGALHLLSRRSRLGLAMRAVMENRDAARLMGVPTEALTAGAFALSSLLAGAAGVLIAPLFHIQSDMGVMFGLKAFAAAILGGVRSASGVMAAGLLLGLGEALTISAFGSGYTEIVVFSLVILGLALRIGIYLQIKGK